MKAIFTSLSHPLQEQPNSKSNQERGASNDHQQLSPGIETNEEAIELPVSKRGLVSLREFPFAVASIFQFRKGEPRGPDSKQQAGQAADQRSVDT
jgi:hypothetical protein